MANWIPWRKKQPQPDPTPIAGYFYSGARTDYSPEVGSRSLTPEWLGTILRAADTGDVQMQQELFSTIEEDPHVHATLDRRRNQIINKTMLITPSDDSPQAQDSSDLCNAAIFGVDGQGGIPDWRGALFDMTDAIGRAYSVSQIVWDFRNGRWTPASLQYWPQRFTRLGTPNEIYSQDSDQIRIITDDDRVYGEPVEPYQWITHTHKARSTILAKAALLRQVAWFYLFKRFSMKDWAIFLEVYGMPRRVAKYPQHASDTEKNALKNAVIELGKDAAALIPDTSAIEFIETKGGTGAIPHPAMVDACNAEISKCILGGTLTTEGNAVGARSLGEVHERGEGALTEADCLALAETIRRDLCTAICYYNIGPNAKVPKVEFLIEEDEDLLQRAQRDKILIADLKLPVDKRYLYETYDIPEPEGDDENLLKAPVETTPIPTPEGETGEETEEAEEEAVEAAAKYMLRALAQKKRARTHSRNWVK